MPRSICLVGPVSVSIAWLRGRGLMDDDDEHE
jgi:hypothetical protein